VLVLALGSLPAAASTTTLDPTFGAGFRTYSFRNTSDATMGLALRSPNGQMLLGASTEQTNSTDTDVTFMQLTKAGALDSNFGDHGRVVVAGLPSGTFLDRYALDRDGSIVGLAEHNGTQFVFRLAPTGSPDLNFGTGGVKQLTLAAGERMIRIAVDGSHHVLLGGQVNDGVVNEAEILRLKTNGDLGASVSHTFGNGGAGVDDIAVSPDGSRIAVEVFVQKAGNGQSGFGVWMLNGSTLDPDPTFGNSTGQVILRDPNGLDSAVLLVDNAHTVTAAGEVLGETTKEIVARFTSTGTLDQSFGTHGKTVVAVPNYFRAMGMVRDSQGRLVLGSMNESQGFTANRLTANGHVDTSFGSGGSVTLAPPVPFFAAGVGIQSTGQIVIGGGSGREVVIRLTDSGALDTGFHPGGLIIYKRPVPDADSSIADGVAISSSGQVFLAGTWRPNSNPPKILLLRTAPNGYPDPRFGTNEPGLADAIGSDMTARAVALDSNGRALTTGCAQCSGSPGPSQLMVMRFRTNGKQDINFEFGGETTMSFATDATGLALAVDTDDSVVSAGFAGSLGALAKFTNTGDPDTNFSGDGKTTLSFPNTLTFKASAVLIQPDHKIVVAGTLNTSQTSEFGVARFLSNGTLDSSFGTNGRVKTLFSGPAEAFSIARRSDGAIIVVGQALIAGHERVAIARYLSTGHPDTSLNGTGQLSAALGPGDDAGGAVIADGNKMVVAATNFAADGTISLEIARFLASGSLDTSFNGTGFDLAPLPDPEGEANAIAGTPSGSYIVAGSSAQPSNPERMVAAKFTP
jgi:uncharacterized delta-60 repeat protein